ncbi:hypothetical protein EBB54_12620 [Schaedlerella arabinosiphila]|uniref:Uncharacterized protein n=1 Tax=Schaedlerella arabinosiphila TaxID=2044587 RepID=A0A3R8JNU3_9FIRM|nr:hypothetical protein [Schaedlerella arabinosiphila]RRK32120.1 hypothetical protein EBB54_12620 [Schaedlerella arabinosiphila]
MHKKKKSKKMEDLVSYVSQQLEGIQSIPSVLADRALKIGALSFFALFLGSYMGRQMGSASFIFWSVELCIFGLFYSFRLLRCGEKREYETVEGMVYEVKGRYSIGRVCKVGVRMEDGRMVRLLMDKRYRFRIGKTYRFYFHKDKQNVLTGMKNLDAALNIGSFYGVEELE